MHLRYLEMYCDAVELRSFSRAAEHLNISQSAVSQAVQLLEKRLGVGLVDRSKRPFGLTEAGKIYFEGSRDLLATFHELEDKIRGMGDRVTGRVRVAAIYSVGLLQINEVIDWFRLQYPEVEVLVDYVHPDEVYRRVEQEQDELGLISFPKAHRDLSCVHWQDQRMVIAVGRSHPWFNRSSIKPAEFNGARFVGFSPNLQIRRSTDRWFRNSGVHVNMVHEFDNIEYVKRDVESGSGAALLPEPTIVDESSAGRLHCITIEGASWVRPLGIIHRKSRELSVAAMKLMEALQKDHAQTSPCPASV
ncbi:MAG: LysR family transcriptional regulator [Planctomycetaceae bacterium]|nr:LysR family transcriptional regulator [Planctomycetaceae bacterium]